MDLGRPELAEYPGELLCYVNRTVIQVHLQGYAPAEYQSLESVFHAGKFFVEVIEAVPKLKEFWDSFFNVVFSQDFGGFYQSLVTRNGYIR